MENNEEIIRVQKRPPFWLVFLAVFFLVGSIGFSVLLFIRFKTLSGQDGAAICFGIGLCFLVFLACLGVMIDTKEYIITKTKKKEP